jgi:hypothetical protein
MEFSGAGGAGPFPVICFLSHEKDLAVRARLGRFSAAM